MPTSRPRNSRASSPPPERSVLAIPQGQAEAVLKERIEAGRELAATQIPDLDASAGPPTLSGGLGRPHPRASGQHPDIAELKRRVSQWRDYNRTWLAMNLGGEAAEEYKSASTHWGFGGSDNPVAELRFLREEVESEISKLESIHDRLHMWTPVNDIAQPESASPQSDLNTPIFIVHGRDTIRAESIARTVERATQRETIILREQPHLGQTLIEKFESNATQASYAIIVLTPDDEGSLRGESSVNPRARQNVIFEMGYFYGRIGRRNVAVLIHPTVEKPSDTHGIAYIELDDEGAWKNELFRELRYANFNITL